MAWPVPDKTHGADACEVTFVTHVGCLDAWGAKEREVGWLMIGVVVGAAVWQILGVAFGGSEWAGTGREGGKVLYEEVDEEEGEGEERRGEEARRIGYQRFTDDVEGHEGGESGGNDSDRANGETHGRC